MQFDRYVTGPDDAERRLDRIVRRFLPDLPLSSVYRLIRKGLIRVDGKRSSPENPVPAGVEIWIARLTELEGSRHEAADQDAKHDSAVDLSVVFECEDLLVINKPVGLAVHGKDGLDGMVPQSDAARESLSFRSGPLHRLDRGTSGLIVFSKTLNGARWFSARLAAHDFDKRYIGIVSGRLEGSVEWYDESTDGKPMITFAEPLAHTKTGPARTLVQFRIVTGRKHQIRFQCAKHRVPLEGDTRYNTGAVPGEGGYYLHAYRLGFGVTDRPEGLPPLLSAPLPARFSSRILTLFGKDALARLEP